MRLFLHRFLITVCIAASCSFPAYLKLDNFAGGINQKTSPEKIANNQATEIINMDFDVNGAIKKRSGVTVNNTFPSENFIAITGTGNGLIKWIHVTSGSYEVAYGTRFNSSASNNMSIYSDGAGNFFKPVIDFSNLFSNYQLAGKTFKSVNIDFASTFLKKFVLISQNVDISTITNGMITSYRSDVTFLPGQTYNQDMTDVFNTMSQSGLYAFTVSSSVYMDLASTQLNQYESYTYSIIVNIDNRQTDAVMFDDHVSYKGVSTNSSQQQYANVNKDIYFTGQASDIAYNNYTNSFQTTGYYAPRSVLSVLNLAVSGNLNGSYNYAVTNIYDGLYESNASFVVVNSPTCDYSNAVASGKVGTNRYIVTKTDNNDYIIWKTDVSNNVLASSYISGCNGTYKRSVFHRNSLYLQVNQTISKINLDTLLIESTLDIPAPINISNRNQDFFIFGDYIYVAVEMKVETVIGTTRPYLYLQRYDENLVSDKLIAKILANKGFGDIAPYLNAIGIQGFASDANYIYLTFYTSGSPNSYKIVKIPVTNLSFIVLPRECWYSTDLVLEFTIPAYASLQNKSVENSASFWYDNYKAMNYSSPLSLTDVSINFSVVSSDLYYGFQNNKEYEVSTTLSIISTNAQYYVTVSYTIINGQLRVLVPTSNSTRVTGRTIYRQRNGGGFYRLYTINDNVTITFDDNISDLNQSVVPLEYDNNVPVDAIDVTYVKARTWWLAPDGTVWYSKINKPEAISSLNYINIITDEDDKPLRLSEMFDCVVVFFAKSTYVIDISNYNPITWFPRKLDTDVGLGYPFSVCQGKLPNQNLGLFYLASDKSIRVLNGQGKATVQQFDNIYTERISLPIEPSLNAIIDNSDDVYMSYFNYKLYLNVPSIKTIFVWDATLNAFTSFKYPISFKYFGEKDEGLYAGHVTQSVLYQLETGSTDVTDDITYSYRSKIFAPDFEYTKVYDKMWLRGVQSDTGNITMTFWNNRDNFTKEQTITVNMANRVYISTGNYGVLPHIATLQRFIPDLKGRDIQFQITGTPNFRLEDISLRYNAVEE